MTDFMSPRDWNDPKSHQDPEAAEQEEAERIANDQMQMIQAAQGLASPMMGAGGGGDHHSNSVGFGNNGLEESHELNHAMVIDTPIEEQLRRLLVRFFICYAPHRLCEIPQQLNRLQQSGATAEQVYKRLKDEYGCVPVEREVEIIMRQSFITRLYCYFARHNPSQFRNVPYLAKKYQYCQRELFIELETKYGADQDPLKLFAPEEKNEKEDLDKLLDDESSSDSDFGEGGMEPSMMVPPQQQQSKNENKDNNNKTDENDENNNNNEIGKDEDRDLGKSFSNALGFSQTNANLLGSFAGASFAGARALGAGAEGKENNNNNFRGFGGGDDDDDEDNEHQPYYQNEDELVHNALSKVGVDISKLRQPLPRFHDPLGTSTSTKVAPEDMEML